MRSDGDLHMTAGGRRNQNVMHGLGDIIGLNHLAPVELPVERDQ